MESTVPTQWTLRRGRVPADLLAPFGRRAVARAIDWTVMAAVATAARVLLGIEPGRGIGVLLFVPIAYEVLPVAVAGTTLGKRVMGLRVMSLRDVGRGRPGF